MVADAPRAHEHSGTCIRQYPTGPLRTGCLKHDSENGKSRSVVAAASPFRSRSAATSTLLLCRFLTFLGFLRCLLFSWLFRFLRRLLGLLLCGLPGRLFRSLLGGFFPGGFACGRATASAPTGRRGSDRLGPRRWLRLFFHCGWKFAFLFLFFFPRNLLRACRRKRQSHRTRRLHRHASRGFPRTSFCPPRNLGRLSADCAT